MAARRTTLTTSKHPVPRARFGELPVESTMLEEEPQDVPNMGISGPSDGNSVAAVLGDIGDGLRPMAGEMGVVMREQVEQMGSSGSQWVVDLGSLLTRGCGAIRGSDKAEAEDASPAHVGTPPMGGGPRPG